MPLNLERKRATRLKSAKKDYKNTVLHEIGLAQLPAKKVRTAIACRNDMSKARARMINRKLTAEIPLH